MLPLFALPRRIEEPIPFLSHPSLLQKSLYPRGLQLPLPPLELKRYFRPRREKVFDCVISSALLFLNDHNIPTHFYRSYGSRSSHLLPALSPSLAFGRCFRTWVQISYQFY